ncbi:DUF2946 domain-containing protein [Stenotrophobium rhamnosiphilum]|uniref:DUF2946 domain-containing protein n=1 Tax=Stenotrophobium rhamnosiphilum TaxID=2029166 RepID=A0A2T5MIK7_9GAMM|nr:DUF2946 domain-containing protein [Stenotrophobium rhamnosiphilum]PTU32390.1 hypothetical protein CJD38_07000 [Stenotrophobium rhamnosiphilum]
MSSRLRQFISRFLLIALVFNALTPLIAAAQDRAGKGSILEFCTASGLKQIAVNLDGKTLPSPDMQKNACPFCLLTAAQAALPSASLTLAYLQLQAEPQPEYLSPAQPRSVHRLTAAPRGPPALS